LRAEIERAPVELEIPLAGYVAHGLNGPEGFPYTREETEGLIKRFPLGRWQSDRAAFSTGEPTDAAAAAGVGLPADRQPTPGGLSPVGVLLARGVRFSLGAVSAEEETGNAELPTFVDLRHVSARAALARRFPQERHVRVIARRYERDVRALLFPVGLLWLVLPAVAWWLRDTPLWPLPLVMAALSMALMLWLVIYYAQWAFDESLRVRDFDYLVERLGKRVMLGELEEAMGSRNPRVRELAIELLLFHDGLVSQQFTPPAPGLRKFLKRV
jgi:hypothetical protein